ncbi:MAG: type III-A CRISPR-associated RAMP protein Csm5 [Candidatus Cloacimonas sp. 4484_209]|nr:MAG: type III-A CRISPR-associated RAMP protein Csm5 [Candidatus Cloacimonas sp. 4484_209]
MEIKLETLTPVHVGTGNSYGKAEFIIDDHVLKRIIFSKLYDSLPKKQKNELTTELERENFRLEEFIKRSNIEISDDMIWYHAVVRSYPSREIREQIKTNNVPYIPGSSIKGSIRTALLWKFICEDYDNLRDKINSCIYKTLRSNLPLEKKKKNICNEFISKVFQLNDRKYDAKYDLLKFLHVSDFMPNEEDASKIIEIEKIIGYSLKRDNKFENWAIIRTRRGNRRVSLINYLEVVKKDIEFNGSISLNPLIKVALENNQEYPLLKDKLEILGLDESNLEEEKMLTHIKNTLREFNKWAIDKEIELCRKASNGRNFCEVLESIDTGNSIRIGFGVGTTYQTLIKLIEEKDVDLAQRIVNTLRLGKFSRNIKENKLTPPYPKSIEFTSQKEPLGWMRFEQG